MPTTIEAAVKNQTVSLAETIILAQDRDWAGNIDYHTTIKGTSVATLGIFFRWKDRRGTNQVHSRTGLLLTTLGPLLAGEASFNLWTQFANPSNITLELVLTGIIGTGSFDFFCNGFGNSYGA